MKCIYCGSKTSVTNSRPTKIPNGTWRRRQCYDCGAIFTSRELADLTASIVYAPREDQLEPFSRDLLLTSVYESCKHRPDAALVAGPLTDTIIQKVLTTATAPSVIERKHLTNEVFNALGRFDEYAARHYEAYFMKRA